MEHFETLRSPQAVAWPLGATKQKNTFVALIFYTIQQYLNGCLSLYWRLVYRRKKLKLLVH